ncbi:MAG: hypothetical protein KIS67_10810 [Verrucomicrobiae bacterium]|nr:hypothetical protein [Verrucomicrobiae bacterium]
MKWHHCGLPVTYSLALGGWFLVLAFIGAAATYAEFRVQAFSPLVATNEFISGKTADPDEDGLANFVEHALGLDPMRPDAERGLLWWRDGDGLRVAYRVANAPTDVEVRVESSADLIGGGWQPVATELEDTGAAFAQHNALLASGSSQAMAFLRVNAAEVMPPPAEQRWVWFEAESSGGETGPELSNNAMPWVSPGGNVQRNVTIPSAGTYQLWVRKFWNPQAFRWRVGTTDAWKESREQTLTDLVILGGNAGRRVGWANVGSVTLEAGARTFRLEVLAGDANTTAYDCFLLTRDPFTPRGKLKPDEQAQVNQPGWFAFQPAPDSFGFSPIDLRHLNEREAGEKGFIRVSGEDFVHERTGESVRFWAVNVGMGFVGNARSELDNFARAMAKRGVNMVRVHGAIYTSSGTNFGRVDTNRVAQLQYFIKALKREGVYTSLSIYFPLWVQLGPENTAFPGYSGGKHPFALLYFNPAFQEIYREWWRYLLTTPNPHTGLAIKDDPAVAFAEMYNEDSTLFWTFNPDAGNTGNIPDPQRAMMEKRFGDWLLAKYPGQTLAQIRSSRWANLSSSQDDFANGRVGFRGLWNVFNDRTHRDKDTTQFLTEVMLQFHRDTFAYLKQDLGYRGLVYCSNWKTASAQYLDPLDKYANVVADFFDRHGYFGGAHSGPNAAWNIEVSQTYDDRSALKFRSADGTSDDFSNPIFDMIYQRQPSVITEVNWPLPNRYRADMVLMGAAYGALQGSDAIFWFAAGSPTWDGLPGKFSIQTPVVQGQFPAAALIYRQGLVRTAPRVVDIQLAVTNLYALQGTPMPAAQNFDQLRGDDVPPGGTLTNVSVIDSLAFLVGRVGVDFVTNTTPQSQILDLSPFINRTNKLVRSHTGELEWDWGAGKLTVNAPAAQGVSGFLSTLGTVELEDVRIESSLDYGTILLVALDGKPIAASGKLLLQVTSEELPYEWATSQPSGVRTINNRGTVPLLVKNFAGTVRLKRPDAAAMTVVPVDYNGYRLSGTPGHADLIQLASESAYYLIEK